MVAIVYEFGEEEKNYEFRLDRLVAVSVYFGNHNRTHTDTLLSCVISVLLPCMSTQHRPTVVYGQKTTGVEILQYTLK